MACGIIVASIYSSLYIRLSKRLDSKSALLSNKYLNRMCVCLPPIAVGGCNLRTKGKRARLVEIYAAASKSVSCVKLITA